MKATPQKLTSPLKYQHYALVVVNGPFPIDALRYDRCYPFEETDAREIEASLNFGEPSSYRFILITKFSESASPPWFTAFWEGQSRIELYTIDGHRIPTFREAIKENAIDPIGIRQWIDTNLYAIVRRAGKRI